MLKASLADPQTWTAFVETGIAPLLGLVAVIIKIAFGCFQGWSTDFLAGVAHQSFRTVCVLFAFFRGFAFSGGIITGFLFWTFFIITTGNIFTLMGRGVTAATGTTFAILVAGGRIEVRV